MAKKNQNTSSMETRSFQKGMVKDVNDTLMPEGAYISARNAVNNSRAGDLGVIGNEASNEFCTTAPYTIISGIHMYGDVWAIFSTNDVSSEIGQFDESDCSYTTIANDTCLGFSKAFPITGEAKENFDCSWEVYFADGNNPDRSINMTSPPWVQDCNPDPSNPDCIICVDTNVLDCEALRIARLTKQPCIKIEQSTSGGELLNGTYQALIAYTENEQVISDYSIPSNLISLFDHDNVNGSIDIVIEDIDQTYDEFELVVVGFVNQQLVAKRIGIYSTHIGRISLDKIDPTLITIPLQLLPIDRPSYEKSEAIYRNGEYLIRVAPTTRFSFNYQPLANQIKAKWVAVDYPTDYYKQGGTSVGYLRDEVYPFFIRWIYNTNDKTESYHIPGRPPGINQNPAWPADPEDGPTAQTQVYGDERFFEANNTAYQTSVGGGTTPDGGVIVAKGEMGYWESSEEYPDNKPEVWDTLCGKNIRHHKFPDSSTSQHFSSNSIRVLGVEFNNIAAPVDNNNVPIPGIIGYEILTGSREGNKTIIAKGLINNMGAYDREDGGGVTYYQNYPYNDLRTDPFLNATDFISGDKPTDGGKPPLGGSLMQSDKFTFHSPDTQFKHPFLSSKELKLYETHSGLVDGVFNEPDGHPDHKIITDFAFILSALVGFGVALQSIRGTQKSTRATGNASEIVFPRATDWVGTIPGGVASYGPGPGYGVDVGVATGLTTAEISAATAHNVAVAAYITSESLGGGDVVLFTTGLTGEDNPLNIASRVTEGVVGATPGANTDGTVEFSTNGETGLPAPLRVAQAIPTFLAYWSEGTNAFMDLLKAFSRKHQYALQYQSHAFHNSALQYLSVNNRFPINNANYIADRLQEFGGITVNNLYRNGAVGLITGLPVPNPQVTDTSRNTFGQSFPGTTTADNIGTSVPQGTTGNNNAGVASSFYAGLKSRIRNQYGQVDGIKQIPTSSCMQQLTPDPSYPNNYISEVIFGGDTYIGRYTEKNTMFFFSDWMYDLPDFHEYDYRLRKMMPYPTYWMDTHDFQVNDFLTGVFDALASVFGLGGGSPIFPGGWHNFDTDGAFTGVGSLLAPLTTLPPTLNLIAKDAYMYLFNSGVRDFYVESEVNIEQRDWGDTEAQRFYDPYKHTSLIDLFKTDIIKSGNFYKYDYSLSAGRYYQGYASWGAMQFRNYDPFVAESCYTYYPNRLIYSLPQSKELRYDNWKAYLVNNYKDFTSRVTAIKPIAKNGAMILFENEAPISFIGVDTLQTDGGTKVTLGDGGLFEQPLQNLVNADNSYEYGSCQDKLSVINTPAGLFWISQNQGKIFNYAGQLEEISQSGMKWWFDEFLPYKLTEEFPEFELIDNTIIGVGCQSIYDNSDGIVYFAKRDYQVRPEWSGRITYTNEDNFLVDGTGLIKLGDPRYFDNASWTVSYDPKAKAWVSFHDWHPNLLLPSKNNFMSIANAGIWKHNERTDSYCNYYGIDYPFEVELVTPTGQNVNTLKSIEYIMEVYQWDPDGVDRNHVLDFNFDKAVIYNTEQISGELRLNLAPKNNAQQMLTYPRVNPSSIDILYNKVEQKYRFNQFWDITDDRGEFTTARRMMWETSPNGYTKTINPLYVNYNKATTQRKKFRHYQSNLWLRRIRCGVHNMQLKLVNSKNQYSPR